MKRVTHRFEVTAVAVLLAITVSAQSENCRVLLPALSGSYEGGCRKGLASGSGVAQGEDRYEGEFSKGLPHGKGTYRWASGVWYEGEFRNGLREGKGKIVYPDSTITGFWKDDRYAGKEKVAPYKIISSLSVARYSVVRSAEKSPGVRVRLMQAGTDNLSVSNFSMVYDSGSEYRSGAYFGLENASFPLNLKIKYTSQNMLRTSSFNVIFEVILNDPGTWEIILNN